MVHYLTGKLLLYIFKMGKKTFSITKKSYCNSNTSSNYIHQVEVVRHNFSVISALTRKHCVAISIRTLKKWCRKLQSVRWKNHTNVEEWICTK